MNRVVASKQQSNNLFCQALVQVPGKVPGHRIGPGLYTKFGLPQPPKPPLVNFYWAQKDSKLQGDFRGDLLSSSGQVSGRSGLVQVWFSLQLKFKSSELDSEIARLVLLLWSLPLTQTPAK